MAIERKDVEHVARLARLALSDDEIDLYAGQLGKILDHAAKVTSLDTSDVPATSHPVEISNVFRPDQPAPPLDHAAALANAPEPEDGYFKVPRIL